VAVDVDVVVVVGQAEAEILGCALEVGRKERVEQQSRGDRTPKVEPRICRRGRRRRWVEGDLKSE